MPTMLAEQNRPIRVVMFGSGPQLTHDARQFLYQVEAHPEIMLLGAFCQAESQSLAAMFMDLWRRRGLLAFPLFIAAITSEAVRNLQYPRSETALRKGLKQISGRLHFVKEIHAQEVLDCVRALEPDLGLIYGSPILKPKLFEIPKLGTLGIHHGRLPEYRGNKTAFWSIYNGEPVAGVTIQKINEGLDTGSIVKEGVVSIGRKSYPAVIRELEELGLQLYIEAILEVKHATAAYRPQPQTKGKLYRNPKLNDFIHFWFKQTRRRFG
jgi:folate-dependent phosphoribosylglycinamide formyltransferase PurN